MSLKNPQVAVQAGQPDLRLAAYDLASLGYQVNEYFVSGTAISYVLAGAASADGHWQATPADSANYTTRIVVVRPAEPSRFNGTVVVEWLNVSGGLDAAVEWNMTHRELIRSGFAYIAVSAQRVAVEGGTGVMGTLGAGLKTTNAKRYGVLDHPGDQYSFDIFAQVGRLLKSEAAGAIVGALTPRRVIAMGESQSAVFLTTYVNAVDPVNPVYDGFLIHSRFGSAAPVDGSSIIATTCSSENTTSNIVKFRSNLRVPVLAVITETDLMDNPLVGFHGARQPDGKLLRVWEVTGTAHADNYIFAGAYIDSGLLPLAQLAAISRPTRSLYNGSQLDKPMNFAPQHHYVVAAAVSNLVRWITTGVPAATAAPISLIQIPGQPPQLDLDVHGLARGGVRTPWVDVPTARLSGIGNSGNPSAFLVGVGEPFDMETITALYPGGLRDYLGRFEAALDQAIVAGFLLAADRAEIMGLAEISYLDGGG